MLFLDKKGKTTVFSMEFGSYTGMGQFLLCQECSLLTKVCDIRIF